jgi:Metallo-beta-lactamase superfamily
MLRFPATTDVMPAARGNRVRRRSFATAVAVCAALGLVYRGVEPIGVGAAQGSPAVSPDGLEVLEVRPHFFMIAGAGGNIGVQVGEDGVVVVDAGSAASAPAVVSAIKRITPKPIRYVIDTGPDPDHVGGNDVLSKATSSIQAHAPPERDRTLCVRLPRSSRRRASSGT